MIYITLGNALEIYTRIMAQSGGLVGVLNLNGLESALAQPRMTFDGKELYSTIIEKASALGFSLVMNHPFVDGNKRTGHAVMEMFLTLNGYKIEATTDEQVEMMVRVASGKTGRRELTDWLRANVRSGVSMES